MTAGIALLAPGECHVWWARAESDLALLDLLDAEERMRSRSFLREQPRALYLTAHALTRLAVSAQTGVPPHLLRFVRVCKTCAGPHGKPALSDSPVPLELSLSHSGDRVAVALSRGGPVGVDVERIGDRWAESVDALSAEERRALDLLPAQRRAPGFFRYWARKEAVLKATGDGLVVNPATLTLSGAEEPPALRQWQGRPGAEDRIALADLDAGPGYRMAVARVGGDGHGLRAVQHEVGDVLSLRP
nr:TPA_exp: 4'-phosphopantetheinyl transferase [Streptomyces sp. NRRL F-4335]